MIDIIRDNNDSCNIPQLTTGAFEALSHWFNFNFGTDAVLRAFGQLDIERTDHSEDSHYHVTLDDYFRINAGTDAEFGLSLSLQLGLYHDGSYDKLAVHPTKAGFMEIFIDDGDDRNTIASGILTNIPDQIIGFLRFMSRNGPNLTSERLADQLNSLEPIEVEAWLAQCLGAAMPKVEARPRITEKQGMDMERFARQTVAAFARTKGYDTVNFRLAVGKEVAYTTGSANYTAVCYSDEWVAKTFASVVDFSFDGDGPIQSSIKVQNYLNGETQ